MSSYPVGDTMCVVWNVRLELYDVSWVYAFTNITIANTTIPEGSTALVVSVRNVGGVPIMNITANFSSVGIIGRVNESTKTYSGIVPVNYSVTFAFVFEEIFKNVSLSEYDIPMHLKFFAEGIKYEQTIVVPVSVSGVPELEIFAPPLVVHGEGEYNLSVTVRNIGTVTAKWVRVITVGYPPYVVVESPDIARLGFLRPNEEKSASFRVRVIDLPVSSMAFLVNVTFMDERSADVYWIAETVPVIVNESPELILISSVSLPLTVLPGDRFVEIRAIICNPTRKLIRDAEAFLRLPEYFKPSFPGANRISLGSVPPGFVINATFFVDVDDDTPPGCYKLPLEFRYEGGENKENISIVVRERAEFKILDVEPEVLEIGASDIELHIKIKNVASVEAKDVYLEIQSGGCLKGELATYVGEVFPGETIDVTFYTEVSEDAPEGRTPIDMLIVWVQEERVLSEIYRLMLTFVGKSVYAQPYELGLTTLLLLASAYVCYRVTKKVTISRRAGRYAVEDMDYYACLSSPRPAGPLTT